MARRLYLLAILLVLAAPAASVQAPADIVAGESRGGDLVVLGRDVAVDGVLRGTLVAVGCPVRVAGRVGGNALGLGGDVVR
ncbi:MAG: hypothetical protein KJ062_23145, partial [Thermoanaerobaculia bacterium]|nr:hypothetical protein [Thermoanaerobaculia bacterium]